MRKTIAISLLLAGSLLALAGCQKGNGVGFGSEVRFKAASSVPTTRTVYSGVDTQVGEGTSATTWERIDWVKDEELLIWSDKAVDRYSNDKHAVYQIKDVTPNGVQSKATLTNAPGENGLVYVNGVESYKFWGISPKTSGTPVAGQASFAITAEQGPKGEATTTNHVKTFPADMSNAWLVAAVEGAKEGATVEIPFYPAFTAFEFTFEGDKEFTGNITLQKLELLAETQLAGSVVATLAPEGASTYACTPNANPVYTFPGSTIVSQTEKVKFTMFALPKDIVGLKLKIYANVENEDVTFTATLKEKVNDEVKPIELDACKKYRIKGVAVPGNLWKIFYQPDITVDEWVPVDNPITFE